MLTPLIPGLITLLVPLGLQCWLSLILWRKHLSRRFLLFTIYTFYSIAANGVRAVCFFEDRTLYSWVYWVSEIPYVLLGIGSMIAAFHCAVRPFYIVRHVRIFLPVTITIMFLMALSHIAQSQPVESDRLWEITLAINMTARNIQVGIFILLLFLVWLLHIPRRQYSVAVVSGFGIAETGMLAVSTFRSAYGQQFLFVSDYGVSLAYVLAILVWIKGFRREEQVRSPYGAPSTGLIEEVMKYPDVIRRYWK